MQQDSYSDITGSEIAARSKRHGRGDKRVSSAPPQGAHLTSKVLGGKFRSELPLCMLSWCSLSYMLLCLGHRCVHSHLWMSRSERVLSFPKQLEGTQKSALITSLSQGLCVATKTLLLFDGVRKPVSNNQNCQANGPAKDSKPEAAPCQGQKLLNYQPTPKEDHPSSCPRPFP